MKKVKKLQLNKETLRVLTPREEEYILGGGEEVAWTPTGFGCTLFGCVTTVITSTPPTVCGFPSLIFDTQFRCSLDAQCIA